LVTAEYYLSPRRRLGGWRLKFPLFDLTFITVGGWAVP
jgi:hypothetical protein